MNYYPPENEQIQKDLASFDKDFEEAPMEQTFALPDDRYEIVISDIRLFYSQLRQLMLLWELTVQKPLAYVNYPIKRYSRIASSSNVEWLKRDLLRCGLDLKRLSDLPSHLEDLKGVQLNVTKRTKDGYENIYFNQRIRPIDDNKKDPSTIPADLNDIETKYSPPAEDDTSQLSMDDIPF